MKFVKNTQPNRMRKAGKRVLLGETLEEEAARLEKGSRPSCDTLRTWRAYPFLISTGLEQQAIHSTF